MQLSIKTRSLLVALQESASGQNYIARVLLQGENPVPEMVEQAAMQMERAAALIRRFNKDEQPSSHGATSL